MERVSGGLMNPYSVLTSFRIMRILVTSQKKTNIELLRENFPPKIFNMGSDQRDGRFIYRVLEGIHKRENYINMLLDVLPEMERETSFFMQDGASIHTTNDAIDWLNWLWRDRWIGLHSSRLECHLCQWT